MIRLAWLCFRWMVAQWLVWVSQPDYRNMLRFQRWAAENGHFDLMYALDVSRYYEPMFKAVHGEYPVHRRGVWVGRAANTPKGGDVPRSKS